MILRCLCSVACVFLVGPLLPCVTAAEWHVDASVATSGDGTSPETAFKAIQEGIDAASDGDTVLVAEGAYLENIHFKAKDITLTSANPFDPTVVAGTIIDGSQAGPVVTFSGTEDETCILCGFTIRNGLAPRGSGIHGVACHATIRNNTISGNSAVYGGGGLYNCTDTIRNCIIWGNTAPEASQLYECSLPTYSCIQDWSGGGEENTALDPQFVDPDGPDDDPQTHDDNNHRLSEASPCIDAGMNDDWMGSATDLDGNPRIWPGGTTSSSLTVDMGAYEYGSFPFKITQVLPALTWNSRPGDMYTIWSCMDLGSAISTEEEVVSSDGESTSWTDPDTACPCKFYRVEVR